MNDKMACLKNSKWLRLVEVYGNTGGRVWQRDSGRSVQIDFNAGAMMAGEVDKEAGSRS